MTRAEWASAVKCADWTIGRNLENITFQQLVLVALLKAVALTGYFYGRRLGLSLSAVLESATVDDGPSTSQLVTHATRLAELVKQPLRLHDGCIRLAVVIPFFITNRHELAQLHLALWKLHEQTRAPDWIILVDDGSALSLPPSLGNSQIIRLKVNKGPATARNHGLASARQLGAEVVCFMDADCEPRSTWLAEMEKAQQQSPGVVTGKTVAANSKTAIGLFHDLYGTLNGRVAANGTVLYGCTCNLSISAYIVPLSFDESFRHAAFEDIEFCVRARKLGVTVRYLSTAIVEHHYKPGICSLYQQFMRYGKAEPLMAARHSDYLESLRNSRDISSLLAYPSATAETG